MELAPLEWRTGYAYSIGTVEKVKTGTLDRVCFSESPDYSALLSGGEGVILVPKVVGIYQEKEPVSEDEEELGGMWLLLKADIALANTLLHQFEKEDYAHPELIHLVYNPDLFTETVLREFLNDKLGRLALSQMHKVPDFYEKDVTSDNDFMTEQCLRTSSSPWRDHQSAIKAIREYAPTIKGLKERLMPFGMTRVEWFVIFCYEKLSEAIAS